MGEIISICFLGGVIVFQQVYFMRHIQKLLDKMMSGSYQSYVAATKPVTHVKIDAVPDEDLSILQDIR